jgi:putative ABC transport system permease protein
VEGRAATPGETLVARNVIASPGFFEALRIPVLRGRPFDARDDERAPLVALVSAGFARRFFPDEDPIGRRVALPARRDQKEPPVLTVVGVVADVKTDGLEVESPPVIYWSLDQDSILAVSLVLRTTAGVRETEQTLRREVGQVDADQPAWVSRALATLLFGVSPTDAVAFGGIALLLAFVALVACPLPARRAASVDPLVALREE